MRNCIKTLAEMYALGSIDAQQVLEACNSFEEAAEAKEYADIYELEYTHWQNTMRLKEEEIKYSWFQFQMDNWCPQSAEEVFYELWDIEYEMHLANYDNDCAALWDDYEYQQGLLTEIACAYNEALLV